MNVVVDEKVAVLEVLPLRNTVSRDQKIDFAFRCEFGRTFLGTWRESAQDAAHVAADAGHRGSVGTGAADDGAVNAKRVPRPCGNVAIQVVCRVGEGREQQDLPVARVYRRTHLVGNYPLERRQLRVTVGCDKASSG